MSAPTVTRVAAADLSSFEPEPMWYGNGPNPVGNPVWTQKNWLFARPHVMPDRAQFGVLRLLSDDTIQPERGFATHPHNNMEICTYVISGAITHKDSMGTKGTLRRGELQYMTAGTGIRHSEHNESKDTPSHSIQIWIQPRAYSLPPAYGSVETSEADRRDKWAHVVSDSMNGDADTPVKIHQDANIYVSELSPGKSLELTVGADRQAYCMCLEGSARIGSVEVQLGDGATILGGDAQLGFVAGAAGAHLLVIEMAKSDQVDL